MKKLNSKGFGVLEGLLILVIIGIIGGVGFYVYNQNKDANESASSQQKNADQKTTEPKLSIDESKLPDEWEIANSSNRLITLDNSEKTRFLADHCFVEVSIVTDKNARIVGSTAEERSLSAEKYADKKRQERNSKLASDKGYKISIPDLRSNSDWVVFDEANDDFNTSEGFILYPFYSADIYKLTLPNKPESTLYQYLGLIVRDGYHVSIVQSCNSGDLTGASKALKAVKIDIDPLL